MKGVPWFVAGIRDNTSKPFGPEPKSRSHRTMSNLLSVSRASASAPEAAACHDPAVRC